MMTDPIADMLTRIRNALLAKLPELSLPGSKLKLEIARILLENGFIQDYQLIEDDFSGVLRISLKYDEEERTAISGLKRVSKPGRRIYRKKVEIPKVLGGSGIAILSTSVGILSDREARKKNVGGEVLCYVW
ncbi:30S ribosomal protein S8 [candidate division TA06 bacterium]|nr:30S ribosomal protein S8 [candidate division TA06 bacterium]